MAIDRESSGSDRGVLERRRQQEPFGSEFSTCEVIPLVSSVPPKSDFAESEEAAKLKLTQKKTRGFLDSILCLLLHDGDELE